MQRQSNKSAPRGDDQRAHEVRGMVQGAPLEERTDPRLQEGGDPQWDPHPGRRPETAEPAPGADRSIDEALDLADFARHLRPSVFPADKERLIEEASVVFAPDEVLDLLRRLPDGEEFPHVNAVWETLSERRRTG